MSPKLASSVRKSKLPVRSVPSLISNIVHGTCTAAPLNTVLACGTFHTHCTNESNSWTVPHVCGLGVLHRGARVNTPKKRGTAKGNNCTSETTTSSRAANASPASRSLLLVCNGDIGCPRSDDANPVCHQHVIVNKERISNRGGHGDDSHRVATGRAHA